MSTGISISSINRIKELAEEKKYAEALEILDTQNLDKSINPQFLRVSGEIFRENKRYYDSRKILLKAHQMAPQGNRIIFELIQLHLELGNFTKAQRYYEQYKFYSSADDSQKEYVEYIMKKALGADVKELAAILIPILEQMPEDKWNFEAVLLYHKMDRKDKALEESRYILENFKESIFVPPIVDYIDDKLDVDQYFYVYPKEEQQENVDLFGDLIDLEEKQLEADYLRMYPPEARIMVDVEDKDAADTKSAKEKRSKRRNKKTDLETAEAIEETGIEASAVDDVQNIIREAEQLMNPEQADDNGSMEETAGISEEDIQLKQEREAALEKLLSKKVDADKIKESAKQMAKAVKDIDTEKAKNQVKSVADSVKDNVKKATDVIGEAVGTKHILEVADSASAQSGQNPEEQIVDGIIESVLEPPKKAVGQVVMNEELDALIPDSLEAMSKQEIADIEARKEEMERLELEALEASLQLEEQKKAKSRQKQGAKEGSDSQDTENDIQNLDEKEQIDLRYSVSAVEGSYAELKEKYLAERSKEEEQPLDSLGFISVVHSDINQEMEEEIPDAAGMLRQMIDNKEFYAGEDSTKFESKASYLNHGFEVEDYDFEAYKEEDVQSAVKESGQKPIFDSEPVASFTVEDIYAKEQILYFDDIIPEAEPEPTVEVEPDPIAAKKVEPVQGAEWIIEEPEPIIAEAEPIVETEPVIEPEPVYTEPEPIIAEAEPVIEPEPVYTEPEPIIAEAEPIVEAEPVIEPEPMIAEAEPTMEEELPHEDIIEEQAEMPARREMLRVKILLSDSMTNMLVNLKESR